VRNNNSGYVVFDIPASNYTWLVPEFTLRVQLRLVKRDGTEMLPAASTVALIDNGQRTTQLLRM